jgi:hypothetical protein
MSTKNHIFLDDFCEYHAVKLSFINELGEHELVEITRQSSRPCIPEEQVPILEQMVRLHRDLDINIPGIEVALNLINELENHKRRIVELENRLRRFEE